MKVLKWIGIVLGALVLLVVVAVLIVYSMGNRKLSAGAYEDVQVSAVNVSADTERGQHIAEAISICAGCHGPDLSGAPFVEEEGFAVVYAPNLTSGQGGVGATYTDEQWVRAIRHGVGGDGRGLVFMPSIAYASMSDEDLGALIAYLKSVPPVDNQVPARSFGLPAKILIGLGALPVMPDIIEHDVQPTAPTMGVSVEYGDYLVNIAACRDCHGPDLAGQTDPNAPQGVNITPGGDLGTWSEADFIAAIRTGTTPDGEVLSEEMPWMEYRDMTDEELQAIWAYLSSLDALPSNQQ